DFTVRVNRQYVTPAQFAQLPITVPAAGRSPATATLSQAPATANDQNYVVRLGDVARLEEGADDRRRDFRSNGQEEIGFTLTRQSQANDLEISRAVQQAVAQINPTLPGGARLEVAADYTVFTSRAIQEVWITMGLSLLLVGAVNMLFLGDWRAAIIPAVVAP